MRYIIYTRVSTEEQNIRQQEENCVAYCRGNEYLTFSDGVLPSGTPFDKREALMLALEELEKGDILLVFKMDRIARNFTEQGMIQYLVEKKGAKLASLTEPEYEKDDPQSQMMRGILAVFAQYEKAMIRLRTKMRLQNKKANGERVGNIPYGYRAIPAVKVEDKVITPSILMPYDSEQLIIDLMSQLRTEGYTFESIAEYLNESDKLNRRGHHWNRAGVHKILQNLERHRLPNLDKKVG